MTQTASHRRDFLRLTAASALASVLPEMAPAASAAEGNRSLHVIRPEFFGLHMVWPTRRPYAENFPSVPVGAWRAILPELHWFSLEPSPGEWKFDKLDIAMRLMESRKIDVMLTLGETPAWASSKPDTKGEYVFGQAAPPRHISDWENYIRTVAQRYKGRIRHYELWNEPTVREVDGYRAHFTARELVELGTSAYRIIKETDPQARLTTPSMVGGEKGVERLDAYLAAGGNKCTDIIGFHYYGLPEQIQQYHAVLFAVMKRRGVAHLPVWNTEFGFLIADPDSKPEKYPVGGGSFSRILPETEAASWLARSLIIAASIGIERFYWFMWDGEYVGLQTYAGHKIKSAGIAFGTLANWLTSKQIGPMQQIGNVVFCPLHDNNALIGYLVWTRDYGSMRWTIPSAWKATKIASLDGQNRDISSVTSIDLSASPVLIRSSS
jgi:hypothetical protein